MTIAAFDHLDQATKKAVLQQCCGSTAWVTKMLGVLPVEDLVDLLELAEETWYSCEESDWREAFTHHPKIGDMQSMKEKFSSAAHLAAREQASVQQASENILHQLAAGNKQYEDKFGYIFIVCATGKSAGEMLALLNDRLDNQPLTEILIAMEEQNKITRLRLEKIFSE